MPRNRRIAETFARCGLVERSGQGADRMLEECVRQGKLFPDYSRSDANQVWLTLHGQIQDEAFLRFLERIGAEALDKLDAHDFLIVGLAARQRRIPDGLKPRVPRLLELGILDRIARGKLIPSKRLYEPAGGLIGGKTTTYLDREQARDRLMAHIERHRTDGSPLKALLTVVPSLSRDQVKAVLKQLRAAGKISVAGGSKNARWYPVSEAGFGSESRGQTQIRPESSSTDKP